MKGIRIFGLAVMASLIFSCNTTTSLQQFIVDKQDDDAIISFDIPASVFSLDEHFSTDENIETLKSIKKANVLAFAINDSNPERYKKDKLQLKSILKQPKYTELMRFGNASKGAKIVMLGDDESVNELLIFASDNTTGWLLIRVLGKAMQPEKILSLLQKMDFNENTKALEPLKELLKKTRT